MWVGESMAWVVGITGDDDGMDWFSGVCVVDDDAGGGMSFSEWTGDGWLGGMVALCIRGNASDDGCGRGCETCECCDSADVSRLACSNAVAKARTEAKRSSGFLARAVNTTCSMAGERAGSCACREGGGVTLCLMAISVKEPWKGRLPLSHS